MMKDFMSTIKFAFVAAVAFCAFGAWAAYTDDCITFTSADGFSLRTDFGKSWEGTLWTSTDKTNWTAWEGEVVSAAQAGGTGNYLLYVRGDDINSTITDRNNSWMLSADGLVACTGNIETLRGASGNSPSPTEMASACYQSMFVRCESLTEGPALPAMTLSEYCYCRMFEGCSSLEAAPALPATTLVANCYDSMFASCGSLTTASALPATELADGCYASMFASCLSLESAPALPATELADGCYSAMFRNCSSLTNAPTLNATKLASSCYASMFSSCTSLVDVPVLPATTLADDCYALMFESCIQLIVNETAPGKEWKMPVTSTTVASWGEYMFSGTGGTLQDQPALNTTYYIASAPMPEDPSVKYLAPVYKGTDGNPTNGIERWETNTVSTYTVVASSASAVVWGADGATNWYVVKDANVQIDGGVICAGHVNLILCEGAKLVVTNVADMTAGIKTDAYGSFTVYGQPEGAGALSVYGGMNGAGIGGQLPPDNLGKNITINGGAVTAIGGSSGAGVGGGMAGDGSDIAINGGTVTAVGGVRGAGIGGGSQRSGLNITINGGIVSAISRTEVSWGYVVGGSGIGGGSQGNGTGITINGGTVKAVGSVGASGIGGGTLAVGQQIAIGAVKVFVSGTALRSKGSDSYPHVIGNGGACSGTAAGNVISDEAEVFFDLTPFYDADAKQWIEEPAAMPADFESFVIMTPETQTVDRVLVGGVGAQGLSALPTFALTNAITGATGTIAVDGVSVVFAERLLKLPLADGMLTLTAKEYSMINQPTEVANTTAKVYTNGTEAVVGDGLPVTNGTPAYVVYTADDGYVFADGSTAVTNELDTTKNPATADAPAAPGKATVKYFAPVYVDNVASNGIAYWTTNTIFLTDATVIESSASAVTWGEVDATNWYVVTGGDFQIDGGVTCAGHVNLVLCEGAKLVVTNVPTGKAGIATDLEGSLTVYGQSVGAASSPRPGELYAYGGRYGAGIGGCYIERADGSNITINGGRVTAAGGFYAAGIGGGSWGSASHIAINGGVVMAGCAVGGVGACIGGGYGGKGVSDIVLNAGKVYLSNPQWSEGGDVCQGPFIGSDVSSGSSSGIVISKDVDILFNMTGKFMNTITSDPDIGSWTEPQADMPDDFKGLVLLVPDTLSSYGLYGRFYLATGLGAWSAATTCAITNAQTGATDEIDIGEKLSFASTYTRLFRKDENLIFSVELPELWFDQQPNVTNGYAVVARTDGNKGITNYIWSVKSKSALGAQAVIDGAYEPRYGKVDGNTITCYFSEDYNSYFIQLQLLVEGNPYGVQGVPREGELHFTCPLDLSDAYDDEYGVLARGEGADEWIWTPTWVEMEDTEYTSFTVFGEGSFELKNVQWIYTGFIPVVEGADLTAFPVGSGIVGETYQCELVYAHYDTTCLGESEPFTFLGSVGAIPTPVECTTWAVYTNGFLSVEDNGVWAAWTNENATVVYSAEDGYVFADGSTVVTNTFDTTKNPATADAPAAPFAAVASVTHGSAITYYGDICSAWTTVTNVGTKTTPATLTLLTNVTATTMLKSPSDDDFGAIFDLNDKVITFIEGNDVHIIHQHGKLSVVDNAANKTTKYFVPDADGRWTRTDAVTERAVKGGYFTGYAWLLMLEGGDVEVSDVSFVGAKRNPVFTQSVNDLTYGKCTLSRVNFLGNVCEDGFGANPGAIDLACREFQYVFEDCVFRENVSPRGGGAIGRVASGEFPAAVLESPPRLVRCVFENNRSLESDGGAVRLDANMRGTQMCAVPYVHPMIFEDCAFGGNEAGGNGGAIAAYCNAQVMLKNCVVTNNAAGGNGGGICMDGDEMQQGSDPKDKCVLINTTITGNRAKTNGGGVYFARAKCLAAGTRVLMADGTEKAIEEVVEGDVVRTFDHEGGTNASARVYLAFKGETKDVPFMLTFDNGATLSVVGRHDLLEQSSRKYVTIRAADAHQYIGAKFYGADGAWHALAGVTAGTQAVDYYSLYTAQHQNAYANGLLTVADDVDHLLNIYELDENLKADAEQLAADISAYSLATFEECATKYGMSRSWYDDAGAKYNYVAIGKGLVTLEGLEALLAASTEGTTVPKLASLPKLTTSSAPNASPFDDYGVGVLTLGTNVVIANNYVGTTPNNVYLNYSKGDSSGISRIVLLPDHTGLCVGVTTVETPREGFDVPFTSGDTVAAGDVAYFTPDDSNHWVIYKDGALCLSVDQPPEPVEYVAPAYKGTDGNPTNGIAFWVTNSVIEYTVVTSATSAVTWGESGVTSWYVVKDADVQIDGGVTCQGHVNLILCDGGSLTVTNVGNNKAGIATDSSGSFAVYGQPVDAASSPRPGELYAYGDIGGAGIGGGNGDVGENITINGGVVTATGGAASSLVNGGAGIGGGNLAVGSNITINGGRVTATGGDMANIGGAGIGGANRAGSNITINGGTVMATGGRCSAAIGGGDHAVGSDIVINGGTVTAIGGCQGAAIGGGSTKKGENISIANATVKVRAIAGASTYIGCGDLIGSGMDGGACVVLGRSNPDSENVTIDASAKVLFNLTGLQNVNIGSVVWIEEPAPMPEDFEGFVILTPDPAVARTLVGGVANWTASTEFTLAKPEQDRTKPIVVNGEAVPFASKSIALTHGANKLAIGVGDLPDEPIVKDDKGNDMEVVVPQEWRKEKCVSDEDAVDTKNPTDNGMPAWQSYVLGLDPTNEYSGVYADTPQNAETDTVTVVTKNLDTQKLADGFSVRYRLDTKLKGAAEYTKGTTQESPSFDVKVDEDDPTGVYQLNAIIASNGVEIAQSAKAVNVVGMVKAKTDMSLSIVAVPWGALAPGEKREIAVSNLLKTATLAEGDRLHVLRPDTRTYDTWTLGKDKTWGSVTSYKIGKDGRVTAETSGEAAKTTVARGNGVWLERSAAHKDEPYFLYGQHDDAAVSCELVEGHNLLGAPSYKPYDLSNVKGAVEYTDQIQVPTADGGLKLYTFKDGKWGYYKTEKSARTAPDGSPVYRSVWTTDDTLVPAGTGYWLLNKSGGVTVE